MRPKEFGYEVVLSRRRGVTYRNMNTGKLITNNKVFVASKEFLIEDIYLMHKLKLRPEKMEKDRQRLTKLSKVFDKNIPSSLSIDDIFKRIKPRLIRMGPPATKKNAIVPMNKAKQINPYNYKNFTTKPSEERISKQLVYALKPVINGVKINGYENSNGNKRFNLKTLTWQNVTNNSYVKNEFKLRSEKSLPIPKNINTKNTLYGYKPKRNAWVPKKILDKASAIPFVGLKK